MICGAFLYVFASFKLYWNISESRRTKKRKPPQFCKHNWLEVEEEELKKTVQCSIQKNEVSSPI